MSIQSPVYGRCGRIGLIVPANNSVIEPEFWSVLPPGVAAYGTRVMAKGDLTVEAVKRMEADVNSAVAAIAATGVDVIAYCDMVTTFIMGRGGTKMRVERIRASAGIPALSAWTALRDALSFLGVRRFALGTPYPRAIHALARPFFKHRGYEVHADATLDNVAHARGAGSRRRAPFGVHRRSGYAKVRRHRAAGDRPANIRLSRRTRSRDYGCRF